MRNILRDWFTPDYDYDYDDDYEHDHGVPTLSKGGYTPATTTADPLEQLRFAYCPDATVVRDLATNPHLHTVGVFGRLLEHPDPLVRRTIVLNHALTPDLLVEHMEVLNPEDPNDDSTLHAIVERENQLKVQGQPLELEVITALENLGYM